MNSTKTTFTIHDFVPTDGDLQLTVINKMVALDLLVNVVSLIKYEHHDPLRGGDMEYSNQRYGYYWNSRIRCSDWQIFVSTCYEQITLREEAEEVY